MNRLAPSEAVSPEPVMTGHDREARQRPQALYAQIRESLRERIADGEYKEHDRLPSESELMKHFAVSRITVRQALSELESEQLIFRVAGKGSFVQKPRPYQELARLQGFGEAMSRLGYRTLNRVIGITTLAADRELAERLKVPVGSPLTEIRRVRSVEGQAVSLDVTYVRRILGERLAREDLEARDIFVIIENDYGMPLGHADLSIDATVADGALPKLLGVAAGSPILRIERLTWTRDGEPIDFERLYYRGDGFRYRIRAERG